MAALREWRVASQAIADMVPNTRNSNAAIARRDRDHDPPATKGSSRADDRRRRSCTDMFGVPTASSSRPSVDGHPKKLEPGLADHLPGLRFPFAGCEPWRSRQPSDAFEHVWQEARNAEELLTNIEHLAADRAAFVMGLFNYFFCTDHEPELIANDKSTTAESLISSSLTSTTSTGARHSPSTAQRRSSCP